MKKKNLIAVSFGVVLIIGLSLGIGQLVNKNTSEIPENSEEIVAETTVAVTTKEIIPPPITTDIKPKTAKVTTAKPRVAKKEEFEIPPPNDEGEIVENFAEITSAEPPPPPTLPSEAYTNPAAPPEYEPEQTTVTKKPPTTEITIPEGGAKQNGQIYVPGFGWVKDEGGEAVQIYAEDMYENGNKIGYFG